MNTVLTMLCFLLLFAILALPLGLIAIQFIADIVRRRKQKTPLTEDVTRTAYAVLW
jgi:hypothetical protein